MKQFGDITTLSGYDLDPVDLIVGGSPCQDLSAAGKRAGLAGERSGLFLEMIRIIREMREKTNGIQPAYALWENVPGAFSSNNGADFSAVLGEFARLIEPKAPDVPCPEDGWTNSGILLVSNGSIAWRTHDAQFFGVPQRRRRIALIVSFRDQSAWKILSESASMPWNTQTGGTQRKDTPQTAERCAGDTGGSEIKPEISIAFTGDNSLGVRERERESIAMNPRPMSMVTQTELAATLGADDYKQPQIVLSAFKNEPENQAGEKELSTMNIQAVCYGISSYDSNSMKSNNPDSGIYEADTSRSLDTKGSDPSCNQGGIAIIEPAMYDPSVHHGYRELTDVSETVRSRYGTGGNNTPFIVNEGNQAAENTYCIEGNGSRESHLGDGIKKSDVMYTLNTVEQHAVYQDDPKIMTMQGFGDYQENDTASALKQRDYKDATDLVCGEISPDNTHDTEQVECYGESSFAQYSEGVAPVRSSGGTVGWGGKNLIRKNLVRRLTPLECERLQGLPGNWTLIPGATDSKRYRCIGNGIALPFWQFLAERFVSMGGVKTIGSLFDGIGSFPLVFYRAGAKTLWTSEIEPFCQKVVEARFDENGDLKEGWK